MFKKVSKAVAVYGLIEPGQKIGIGLSGGADSVALLDFLVESYPENQWMALHFEHGIRGQDALDDAEFCRKLALQYQIPFVLEHGDVPRYAQEHKMGLEAAGRLLRYGFFERCMNTYGLACIALAHHRDDQLETILWNMIRGCGAKGLFGMEPKRENYIRPLLQVGKQEILDYLQQKSISYREDATNAELEYSRNYLRHQIIPRLKQLNAGVEDAILGLSCRIKGQTELLMEYLQGDYKQCVQEKSDRIVLDIPKTLAHPKAAQQLMVRQALERVFTLQDVEAKHIEGILQLMAKKGTGKRLSLTNGLIAQVIYDTLVIQKIQTHVYWEMEVDVGSGGGQKDGMTLDIEQVEQMPSNYPPKDSLVQYVDAKALEQCENLKLRNRKNGDMFTPFGGGSKKLKDYLIDQKVPRDERDEMLFLCEGNQVLWAVGLQLGKALRVQPGSSRVLRLEVAERSKS